VITPFSLRDLWLLEKLQKASVSLCPIETLTRSRSPVWRAVSSLLPFGEGEAFTFLLNEERREGKRLHGFVQASHPPALSSLYLQAITPRLDAEEDAQAAWSRLTNHLVAAAARKGIERVFACAAEMSPDVETLLGLGFSTYTREDIYWIAPDRCPKAIVGDGLRAEQSSDLWEINRLYRAITPHLVQQAESPSDMAEIAWLWGPVPWSHGEGIILQDQEGIAAYGHLTPGRVGHWLSIFVHPRAYDRADRVIDYALALLDYYPPHPVYCAVREYQGGVRALLEERGFEVYSVQCCLVRHTMARVTEPARSLVHALEKRVEAPTTTVSPSKGP
jgi:hypothetical protein